MKKLWVMLALICVIWMGVSADNFAAPAIQYKQVTTLSSSLAINNGKSIVKDINGNYYAVFTTTYNSYAHIYVRRSTDGGATWQIWNGTSFVTGTTGELPIESSGSYGQSNPTIAADSSGNIHVVWYGTDTVSTTYT